MGEVRYKFLQKMLLTEHDGNRPVVSPLVYHSRYLVNNFKMFSNTFRLQKENENLVGKYAVHSNVLQSEVINLPNTVDVSNLIKATIK